MIVADASLAAKWLFWEEGSDAALLFLERYQDQLVAPDLIVVEVASALVRTANMHKHVADEMQHLLDRWCGDWGGALIATVRSTPPIVRTAGRLAIELGHPIADCVYLALAIENDCDLVTCDAKFAAKAEPVYPRARTLTRYLAA
ncbi:type II toxin-antitoxin system VapC family toxin [Sphingomonas sp. RS2018]